MEYAAVAFLERMQGGLEKEMPFSVRFWAKRPRDKHGHRQPRVSIKAFASAMDKVHLFIHTATSSVFCLFRTSLSLFCFATAHLCLYPCATILISGFRIAESGFGIERPTQKTIWASS